MVNHSNLDKAALIALAIAPDISQPKKLPKAFTPYTPNLPESSGATSRKRTHDGRHGAHFSDDDDLTQSDSSETARYSKKPKRHIQHTDSEAQHPIKPRKRKYRASSFLATSSDSSDHHKSKSKSKSHKKPRKTAALSKQKKAIGTPVPWSLEKAHEADKQLFKLKAEGKPWKEIKKVWEDLMGKTTGDSTLSVRYCKMKENFEKTGGKDVGFVFLFFGWCCLEFWLLWQLFRYDNFRNSR